MNLSDWRKITDRRVNEYKSAKASLKKETRQLERNDSRIKSINESQVIIQTVATQLQNQAHKQIASVVSHCLQSVFDDPYDFIIDFQKKRGRTEAVLTLKKGDMVIDNPMDGTGGGVLSVAGLALRVACLLLSKPPGRKVLFFDEPFKDVSQDNQPRVAKMLETLSKEMGIQFVMITHIDQLKVGKVVEL